MRAMIQGRSQLALVGRHAAVDGRPGPLARLVPAEIAPYAAGAFLPRAPPPSAAEVADGGRCTGGALCRATRAGLPAAWNARAGRG